ncbi:MAG: hypothetical protein ACYDCS_12975 [Candidatus Dormibacteria bacterium]
MTERTPEGGGAPLSFKKVQDPAQFERAPASREPVRDTGGPHLAFEAAPRMPLPPAAPDPRTLKQSPLAPPQAPALKAPPIEQSAPSSAPAFEAVPASSVAAQQRLSTPTIGIRPEPVDVAGPVSPGGTGWNIRGRDEAFLPNRGRAEARDEAAWETRELPNANRDRSAWMVPDAPRRRRTSARQLLGVVLSLILVAILGFAGYEWVTGRAHPVHTISTPPAVGALTAIRTPVTVAVTQQMQKVMQAHGATRVVSGAYGQAGRPTLVVLLAQGPSIETSTNQFFSDFTTGLRTQGVIVNGRALNTTTSGSNFICSPATGPAPLTAVSLCGWDDGDTIGLVMDVTGQPVTATLRDAVAARGAGEH